MIAPSLFVLLALFSTNTTCQLIRVPIRKASRGEPNQNTDFLRLDAQRASLDINNLMNSQYTGVIQIGSNEREFEVVLDTGSSNLWVPDISLSAKFDNSYDCSRSKTCQAFPTSKYPLLYGTGGISGYKVTDQVTIGDMTIPQFDLLLAFDIEQLPNGNFDGILGLSLGRYISEFPTVLEALKNNRLVDTGTFSMYLGDDPSSNGGNTGEIIFGGHDPKYAASDFKFIEVISPQKTLYWAARMKTVAYGDNENMTSTSNVPAVFDSGTSLLVMPANFVRSFINQAAAQGVTFQLEAMSGLYACDCSAQDILGDLVFNFEGASLRVPASSYILSQFGRCFLGMQPKAGRISLANPVILGDVLLKNYYTLYTADNRTIGFADAVPLKHFPLWIVFVSILGVILLIILTTFICNKRNQKESSPYLSPEGVAFGGHYSNIDSHLPDEHHRTHDHVRGVVFGGSGGARSYPVFSPQKALIGSRDSLY